MPRPKTNWTSTPDSKRARKGKHLTLAPETHAALSALAVRYGGESTVVDVAVGELAARVAVETAKEGGE